MPLPHPSRRTGRRLLATGALAAVAVLGTPAIASAEETPGLGSVPVLGGLLAPAQQTPVVPGVGGLPSLPGLPGSGGTPTLPGAGSGTGDPADSIEAGAACVQGLINGIQVSVTGIGTGLVEALAGLAGGSPITLPGTSSGSAAGTIPTTPEDIAAALDPGQLADAIADGQENLTMVVEVIIDGVTHLVEVVIDFAMCLASLIPSATPTTPAPTTQPAAPAPVAPVVTPTTTPAPVAQPVAYPGYAPTGGAPTDDGATPLALAGLAALSAAAGGGALWLRRRGITD